MMSQRHLLLAVTLAALAVPAVSYAAEAEGKGGGDSRWEPDEWVPIEDLGEPDEALEQGQPALDLPLPPEPVQPDTPRARFDEQGREIVQAEDQGRSNVAAERPSNVQPEEQGRTNAGGDRPSYVQPEQTGRSHVSVEDFTKPTHETNARWPKPSELADRLGRFDLVEVTTTGDSLSDLNRVDPGEPLTIITRRRWNWTNKPKTASIEDSLPTPRRRADSDSDGNETSDSTGARRRSVSDSDGNETPDSTGARRRSVSDSDGNETPDSIGARRRTGWGNDGNETPDSIGARRRADVFAEVWKIGKCDSRGDNVQIEAEWVTRLYGPRPNGLSAEQIVRLASSVSEPLGSAMRKALGGSGGSMRDRIGNVGFELSRGDWAIFDLRPIQPLIKSMKSERGRWAAPLRLGWIGPRAEEPLIDTLLSNSPDVTSSMRSGSAKVLACFQGPESLLALRQALKDPASDVRRVAVGSLTQRRAFDEETVQAVVETLTAEGDAEYLAAAIRYSKGLDTIRGSSVVPALKQLVRSDEPWVRLGSAEALWKHTQDAAIVVPALMKQFYQDQENSKVESAVLGLLDKIGAPAVESMCHLLDDRTLTVCRKIDLVRALRDMGPCAKAALPTLRSLQRHEDAFLREVAAEAQLRIESSEDEESRHGSSGWEPDEWVPIEDLGGPDEALEHGQPALAEHPSLPPEPVEPNMPRAGFDEQGRLIVQAEDQGRSNVAAERPSNVQPEDQGRTNAGGNRPSYVQPEPTGRSHLRLEDLTKRTPGTEGKGAVVRDNPSARCNRKGNALFDEGKWNEAADAYREAIKLDPNVGKYHGNLCAALSYLKKYEKAVDAGKQGVRVAPNDAQVRDNLGNALYGLEKYEEAEAQYREAIRLETGEGKYHANLAGVLLKLGRSTDALEAAQKARGLGVKRHWGLNALLGANPEPKYDGDSAASDRRTPDSASEADEIRIGEAQRATLPRLEKLTAILEAAGYVESTQANGRLKSVKEYWAPRALSGFARFGFDSYKPGDTYLRIFARQWRHKDKVIVETDRPRVEAEGPGTGGDEHADVTVEVWETGTVAEDGKYINRSYVAVSTYGSVGETELSSDQVTALAAKLSPYIEQAVRKALAEAKVMPDDAQSSSYSIHYVDDVAVIAGRRGTWNLVYRNDIVVDRLITSMTHEKGRYYAPSRLGKMGPHVHNKLIDVLQDPDAPVGAREGIARALTKQVEEYRATWTPAERERVVIALRLALHDPREVVRESAVGSLIVLKAYDPESARSVLAAIERAGQFDGCKILYYAEQLPNSRREQVLQTAIKATRNENPYVQWSGAEIVGRLAPKSGEPARTFVQIQLRESDGHRVRLAIGGSLGFDAAVVKEATKILEQVRDPKKIVVAIRLIGGRAAHAHVALPELEKFLKHDDKALQQTAEDAIARIKSVPHTESRDVSSANGDSEEAWTDLESLSEQP